MYGRLYNDGDIKIDSFVSTAAIYIWYGFRGYSHLIYVLRINEYWAIAKREKKSCLHLRVRAVQSTYTRTLYSSHELLIVSQNKKLMFSLLII